MLAVLSEVFSWLGLLGWIFWFDYCPGHLVGFIIRAIIIALNQLKLVLGPTSCFVPDIIHALVKMFLAPIGRPYLWPEP